MESEKVSVFRYLDFRVFLRQVINQGPRGFQAQLAKAMNCQATYLIRILKEEAKMTDEQAFRCGKFLGFNQNELEYLLDLVRRDRASDKDLLSYLDERIQEKLAEVAEVKNRVEGQSLVTSFETQLQYYSSWIPSTVHIATSVEKLQSPKAIASVFSLSEKSVQETLEFLCNNGLVERINADRYRHTGKSLHLPKDSSMHLVFQKSRRELMSHLSSLRTSEKELRFSSAFATSQKHINTIRERLLEAIEDIHKDLSKTDSDEVALLVIDFASPH